MSASVRFRFTARQAANLPPCFREGYGPLVQCEQAPGQAGTIVTQADEFCRVALSASTGKFGDFNNLRAHKSCGPSINTMVPFRCANTQR